MPSSINTTRGSSVRRPQPAPPEEVLSAEDALSQMLPPTDDTPTIISRNPTPSPSELDSGRGIRGRRLAHYELIEPIGVGGMAAVIRARDLQLDRYVALKILPPEMANDPENVRRFHQEARSAAKLDHENIARVFYCGEDQNLHFIAFEFVEGENLRTIIDKRSRLPVGEAVHYILQVAAGLAHASQRGVVHRDIKPSNIIITPAGRAKLVDMGLARSLTPQVDDLTQSGVTLGTFDYISPEQALEPRCADSRSDIYSLGCTFYHALTGRPPVPEGTAAKKLHHHQHVKPSDPRDLVPQLPLEVVQVLDRMIAKDPRERFQTPEQLVQALLGVAKRFSAGTAVPEGMLSVETPMPPRSRPLLWSALGLGLVVGAVLLLDSQSTSHSPPGRSRPTPVTRPETTEPKQIPVVRPSGDPKKPGPQEVSEPVLISLTPDSSLDEVRQLLLRNAEADRVVLEVSGEVELPAREGGLVVRAREKVLIRPARATSRPTLRLRYEGSNVPGPLAILTIQAPESEVMGLRILADLAGGSVPLRGLQVQGGKEHTIRDCVFVQAEPPMPEKPQALVSLLASAEGKTPRVTVRDSVFYSFAGSNPDTPDLFTGGEVGGQEAITTTGRVALTVENCALAPHSTGISIDNENAAVDVLQTTLMLPARRSCAFALSGGTLRVRRCVIARLPGSEPGAVLIRQENDAPCRYEGSDNTYHDLDGYWCRGNDWAAAGWGAFRQDLKLGKGKDDSRRLLSSPWSLSALRQREELNRERVTAFKPQLDQRGVRSTENPERFLGAEEVLGVSWTPEPIDDRADPPRRVLTVEPKVDDPANGVYPTVYRAILDASPGEIITIRHDGALELEPIALNKKEFADVTVRPARQFKPELVFREATEPDAALFRLFDGKLRLESLEITLSPVEIYDERDPVSHTLVALIGNGTCVLKGCTVNLLKGDMPVALASLGEGGKIPRVPGMPPANPREPWPRLVLENCLVRGEGDALLARTARPVACTFKNSVLALSGSLARLEHNGNELVMPPVSQKMMLTLTQSTFYHGSSLIKMIAQEDPRGMLPLEVEASASLFLPSNGVDSLIALEAPEGEDIEDKFRWFARLGKNAYGKYPAFLSVKGEMAPAMMGSDRFKKMDPDATYGIVPDRLPSASTRYPQIRPVDLKGPLGTGATLP
jgi:serine/threonine protein kinase